VGLDFGIGICFLTAASFDHLVGARNQSPRDFYI
jgi:hypothetical protein